MESRLCLLKAVRARLQLDLGCGIGFAPETMLQAINAAIETNVDNGTKLIDRSPQMVRELAPDIHSRPHGPERVVQHAEQTTIKRTPLPAHIVPENAHEPSNPEKEALLADLRERSSTCRDCGLCEKRATVVWGEGSLDAKVMFIGEGPGRDEDLAGRPFVGRSGRVLTDIIEKGMKLPRGEVYIANVVKCRPPGNRDPRPEEVEACSQYLTRQIEVIQPKVIVAVGGVAGCALLRLPPKSPGLRGKWHEYDGVPLRVIFHPSYLLRQRRHEGERTSADLTTWKDIVEVMKKME